MITESVIVALTAGLVSSLFALFISSILKNISMNKKRNDFLRKKIKNAERHKSYDIALVYSSIELQEVLKNRFNRNITNRSDLLQLIKLAEKEHILTKFEEKQLSHIFALEKQIVRNIELDNPNNTKEKYFESKNILEKISKEKKKHLGSSVKCNGDPVS